MVRVPKAVFEGITKVRDCGFTNMFDIEAVKYYAMQNEDYSTVDWLIENKKAYAQGIFEGFEIDPGLNRKSDW